MTEDKMVDGITESVNMSLSKQGSLVCFSPWDCKELDMTEQLNKQQQYNFNVFKKYLVYLKLPVPFLTAPISPSVTSVQSLSCV